MSIEVIESKSAEDFLHELRLSNKRWRADEQFETSKWVFRGHANAEWRLIPKAWRLDKDCPLASIRNRLQAASVTNTLGEFPDTESKSRAIEILLQELTEATAVLEFLELANELGFPTPSNRTRNPKRRIFRTNL